jgi:hypothetical protein
VVPRQSRTKKAALVHERIKRRVTEIQSSQRLRSGALSTEDILHRVAEESGKSFESVKRAYYYKGKSEVKKVTKEVT